MTEIRSSEEAAQAATAILTSALRSYLTNPFSRCAGISPTAPALAHDQSSSAYQSAALAFSSAVSRDASAIQSIAAAFAEDDNNLARMLEAGIGDAT